MDRATIFALSSGAPPAAIGVIRISGPDAGAAAAALAGRLPVARRATLAWLRDPSTGERLDRALMLWFPGPRTATGEDLAELHIHGGRSVAAGLLGALGRMDRLRPAEAGEFTRRAFAHGVIDLAEAEGLADLLAAETETQRRAALANAGGALSRKIDGWRAGLLGIAAQIEAILDFADEDDVGLDEAPVRAGIARLHDAIVDALAAPPAERLRDGIRVVLAGPPNAGKSTLLNALTQRDAAIVSPVAGTTRDVIEAPVAIDGIAFLLQDTAGLRRSDDPVEAVGVARAEAAVAAADIILWLGKAEDCPDHARSVIVSPQSDRYPVSERAGIAVSAVTGDGLVQLSDLLVQRARALLPRDSEGTINMRQRGMLSNCVAELEQAARQPDLLLAAEHMRAARSALDAVVGRSGVEDMLDALFGQFCIGK